MPTKTPELDATEAEFQTQVLQLAHITGWHVMHVRKSMGRRNSKAAWQTTTSIQGWPDLFFFSPRRQEHFAVELKSQTGRLTPEQDQVIMDLNTSGCETIVWRPSDWDEIEERLTRR